MTVIDLIEDIAQMDVLPSMTLREELGFDSFDMAELRSIIEDLYNTGIPDDIVARWITVADVLETTETMNRYLQTKYYYVEGYTVWMAVHANNKRDARRAGIWEWGRGSVKAVREATSAEVDYYEKVKGPIMKS